MIKMNRIEDHAVLSELSSLYIKGETISRLMIILRTKGCSYARKTLGCLHCSLIQHADENVAGDNLKIQFKTEIRKYRDRDYRHLDLFTLGSFFDENEIPREFTEFASRYISYAGKINSVAVESRPEYITEVKLKEVNRWLGNVKLEIGLGIESTNVYVRETLMNKGYSLNDVELALEKMSHFKNVEFLGYVVIKPNGLNEAEAIADSIASIKDIFKMGKKFNIRTRIALQPYYIPRQSRTLTAYMNGEYRKLKLWSVIEILKNVSHLGDISVGLNDEGLSDGRVAWNCGLCSGKVIQELRNYNATNKLDHLLELDCSCKKKWQEELSVGLKSGQ